MFEKSFIKKAEDLISEIYQDIMSEAWELNKIKTTLTKEKFTTAANQVLKAIELFNRTDKNFTVVNECLNRLDTIFLEGIERGGANKLYGLFHGQHISSKTRYQKYQQSIKELKNASTSDILSKKEFKLSMG